MSSAVQCPNCKQRINIAVEMMGTTVHCPMCKTPMAIKPPTANQAAATPDYRDGIPGHPHGVRDPIRNQAPHQPDYSMQKPSSNPLPLIFGLLGGGCLMLIGLVVVAGFLVGRAVRNDIAEMNANIESAYVGQDLLEARQGFETVILDRQNDNQPVPLAPRDLFETIKYKTPLGEMSAYLSKPDDPAGKNPAIIWIFGGFGNGIGETAWQPQPKSNDQSASAFRQHGIVTMYPALRGGNDNPGFNECFYGEVDDILAAADYLSKQEFVDPDRIYLGGHSTGGTLVLLCAASTNRFRAVFSFGPIDDISGYGSDMLPFDLTNQQELTLRNPIHWLGAINCRTFVLEGSSGNASSVRALERRSTNPLIDFNIIKGINHFEILGPVNELLARKIILDTDDQCNISLGDQELKELFR